MAILIIGMHTIQATDSYLLQQLIANAHQHIHIVFGTTHDRVQQLVPPVTQ